jgi:excisionase family DNA binding protein
VDGGADSPGMSEIATLTEGNKDEEAVDSRAVAPELGRLLFSVAEVAASLCVSTTTVRALTRQGDLACVAIGKRLLYRRVDVEAFVESLVEE